jgi:hypothetical protein
MAHFGLASVSLSQELHIAAPQPATLAAIAGWRAIAVSDTPGFAFSERWLRMVPSAAWQH